MTSELNFVKTDINYLTYERAKNIVGRQGDIDRERPDDTIIVFEAIAKSKPEKTKDGMLSGEAWCRAYILCDCGGTHLIRSNKTVGEQIKGFIDENPHYINRLVDDDDKALIVNFLYTVDPNEKGHGVSMYTFRKPDGRIECSMLFDTKGKTEEEIQGFVEEISAVEMPKPKKAKPKTTKK